MSHPEVDTGSKDLDHLIAEHAKSLDTAHALLIDSLKETTKIAEQYVAMSRGYQGQLIQLLTALLRDVQDMRQEEQE